MGIAKNALRERMQRKDMYVVVAIGILLVTLCFSGTATLSVNGVPVTAFETMLPLMLNVITVIGGGIAIALSLRTIPNEYERRTSHLVWVRGISQRRYHGSLALANIISSVGALFVLYLVVLVFAGIKGEYEVLLKAIPAFFLYAMGTAAVSLFTTVTSLVLPGMAAGVVSTAFMLIGTMHPVLETLSGIVSGAARVMVQGLLFAVPNLYEIACQAGLVLSGKAVEIHTILGGLCVLYVCTMLVCLIQKKEA